VVTPEEMKKMQDEYYAYFGWDEQGLPPEKTLKDLELEFTIEEVNKARGA
jgi:aldehyde:ferredoxin oxidoreductase